MSLKQAAIRVACFLHFPLHSGKEQDHRSNRCALEFFLAHMATYDRSVVRPLLLRACGRSASSSKNYFAVWELQAQRPCARQPPCIRWASVLLTSSDFNAKWDDAIHVAVRICQPKVSLRMPRFIPQSNSRNQFGCLFCGCPLVFPCVGSLFVVCQYFFLLIW